MNKKETGSYYTPSILSDFLTNHVVQNYLEPSHSIDILEPSCGDGQFISSLFNRSEIIGLFDRINLTLFDINKDELDFAATQVPNNNTIDVTCLNRDYLSWSLNEESSFNLIIGNPPYIRKKNMEEELRLICEEVQSAVKESFPNLIKSNNSIKNIWPAFVQSNILKLAPNGVLCLVIPAEILQVNYTKELRDLVTAEFDRVEIFAFNELIFEGIQQDVIALIGVKQVEENLRGISFYQVDKLGDLTEPKFTQKFSNIHRTTLNKWTNYILTEYELNLLEQLKNQYLPISSYCEKAEVGIVTAANDYFIVPRTKLQEHNLQRLDGLVSPIVSKGGDLPRSIFFEAEDYLELFEADSKVSFVNFRNRENKKLSKTESKYIANGEGLGIHTRYKMKKRGKWYYVPSVWKSEAMFAKRSHILPKFVVNNADVHATDTFYRVIARNGIDIRKLVFSYYNSLSLILSELEGRYYGGGVLELTPNEFRSIKVPYNENITDEQIQNMDRMLRDNESLETILEYTDPILLGEDVDREELDSIRVKLLNRRLKNKAIDELDDIDHLEPVLV